MPLRNVRVVAQNEQSLEEVWSEADVVAVPVKQLES